MWMPSMVWSEVTALISGFAPDLFSYSVFMLINELSNFQLCFCSFKYQLTYIKKYESLFYCILLVSISYAYLKMTLTVSEAVPI